jgi:hypothetical protein
MDTDKHTKVPIGVLWLVERVFWTASKENAPGELTTGIVNKKTMSKDEAEANW